MPKVLNLPDAHVENGQNLDRFDKAGNVIVSERPDVVVVGGDFSSMRSISHWDQNKRITMEGKRYHLDAKACKEALTRLLTPLWELQTKQRETKSKVYKPTLLYLEGNHEFWITKYVEDNPSMEGHIDLRKDLALDSFGFRIVPYREYVDIGGVLFTHVPIDGSKQAIKGADITKVAARYVGKPCVFFHTHRFECSSVSRVGQPDMQMMTCGCFFEEETEEFGIHLWRGLVMANIYAAGKYDVEQISMERLYRDW